MSVLSIRVRASAVLARTEIKRAVGPESAAYGHGSVWLAFGGVSKYPPGRPLPGRLLRISAGTLRVTASWPVVGSPVGLAVTRRYVWVAGDDGDGKPAAYDASDVPGASLDAIGTRIWQLSARTLRPGPWVKVPVTMDLTISAATSRRLWAIGQASRPGDRWIITELAAR